MDNIIQDKIGNDLTEKFKSFQKRHKEIAEKRRQDRVRRTDANR